MPARDVKPHAETGGIAARCMMFATLFLQGESPAISACASMPFAMWRGRKKRMRKTCAAELFYARCMSDMARYMRCIYARLYCTKEKGAVAGRPSESKKASSRNLLLFCYFLYCFFSSRFFRYFFSSRLLSRFFSSGFFRCFFSSRFFCCFFSGRFFCHCFFHGFLFRSHCFLPYLKLTHCSNEDCSPIRTIIIIF